MLFAVGEAAHHDARQSVLAFEPDEKVLEGHDVENEPAGLVRLDLPSSSRGRDLSAGASTMR